MNSKAKAISICWLFIFGLVLVYLYLGFCVSVFKINDNNHSKCEHLLPTTFLYFSQTNKEQKNHTHCTYSSMYTVLVAAVYNNRREQNRNRKS